MAIARWRWANSRTQIPDYFLVYEGKLFLQRNAKAHMMFSKDPEGNRKKADENWAKLHSQQRD